MANLKNLIVLGASRFIGDVTGEKFIIDGGTSSQFLKADGSVDGTTYLTSSNITGKEDTSNKVTSISSSSTNTQYPSAKAVYDAILTPLIIAVSNQDESVPSGTYASITLALSSGRKVILKMTNYEDGEGEIYYGDLSTDYSLADFYSFNFINSNSSYKFNIFSDDTSEFNAWYLAELGHVHGNINNNGTLYSANATISNGDKLVIADYNSNSNEYYINGTNISFDGSTVTKALTPKGTWETFATLDSNGLVPANQLPSYVDDVIDGYMYGSEFFRPLVDGELKLDATSSDFNNDNKVTPVKNKIYFWVGDGHCYRWSGTEYVLIVASPGTTSNVPEGSNLYFTNARALAAVATLLSGKADKAVPSAANNVALLDSSGNLVDSGKTLGKSVPSTAVFTDVACNEQYHYTPSTADNASNIDLVPDGVLKIITGINLDSKKHIVSVTSGDLTKSMVGLNAVTNDRQVKGLSSGTTSGHIVTFGSDGYTIVDSGVAVSDVISSDTGGEYLPSVTSSDNNKILLVVNGTWTLVTPPAIYSGSTTPSSSLGSNGDIYIQTS